MEISPAGLEQAVSVAVSPSIPVIPGQFFRAFVPSSTQVIPIPVYPYSSDSQGMLLCGRIPEYWHPKTPLLLQGPFGNGFSQSLKSRRLILHASDATLEPRLYFLALYALQRNSDVVWVSDDHSIALPPQVEVLKVTELPAALDWCDGCALTVGYSQATEFPRTIPVKPADRPKVEVLIDAPLVCGDARCGVCSIETRRGWKLACKDGPVFQQEELQIG